MSDEKNKNSHIEPLTDEELEGVSGGSPSYAGGSGKTLTVACACYERNGHNCKKGGTYKASSECAIVFRCIYATVLS
ncbi:MAG TPA: hypothetical protein PKK26_04990 [Candidatus Wallbacteria bacterium]|nr:hypothetical protein [Candidatus Wallbacteria bacterium]